MTNATVKYTRVLHASKTKTPVIEKGNFEDACRLIEDDVIALQKCFSMNVLIDVCGIGNDQHQYRQYLKPRLERHFGEGICLITVEYHELQIVISTECINEKTLSSYIVFLDNRILVLLARIIRNSVDEMIKKASPLSWPPSEDGLESKSREPPAELTAFLSKLLTYDSHYFFGSTTSRAVRSIADDIIHNVSNGVFLTAKQCALGQEIHSMSQQKRLIVILSKLGHSTSYEKVLEIETAEEEVAEQFRSNSSVLPIQSVL